MHKQGDIVLLSLPFTDLKPAKKRPVLVLSNNNYNETCEDVVVAAITSNIDNKIYTIKISDDDMAEGNLLRDSCVRADKLYTLSQSLIMKNFGTLKDEVVESVIKKVSKVFTNKEKIL
jgi:mRNA interferase MazF